MQRSIVGFFGACLLLASATAATAAALKVKDKAPDFTLTEDNGDKFKLSDHLGKKKLVLFFYNSDKAVYCTDEVCTFRDFYDKFEKKGVEVIGISPDTIDTHKAFKAEHHVKFSLLSDPGGKVSAAWAPDGKPLPAKARKTFVLDEHGIVRREYTASDDEPKKIVADTLKGLDDVSSGEALVSP